ncbi:MAG TPA: HlyD family efflux transporter periplasmic adaptor subunit [Anaeromyxobacter sp.]|nr:HlyD family efflux transporter periplasmic adaptor subunit [Anaeromyxobacter sp.]
MSWSWNQKAALAAGALAAAALAVAARPRPAPLVLSGLVTTDEVVVAPAAAGRLARLHVQEGDAVAAGQVLAELEPAELAADRAYWAERATAAGAEVDEGAAAVRYQERETAARVRQAAAAVAAAEQERAALAAQLAEVRAQAARQEALARAGAASEEARSQAGHALEAAVARLEGLDRQVEAQRATLEAARATAEQAAQRRAALGAARGRQAAAAAQRTKAEVRLGYATLTAPVTGVVDVRAARVGEVLAVGQPVLTLVDPARFWVRADVPESLVDRLRPGDRLRVRLPWGEERDGVVTYRGADAGFATQRDVDRTRRDLRTFEVRLHVDDPDRRLALGATVQVILPEAR